MRGICLQQQILQSSIPFKVSILTACNLTIPSKVRILQVTILKYSILELAGWLFAGCRLLVISSSLSYVLCSYSGCLLVVVRWLLVVCCALFFVLCSLFYAVCLYRPGAFRISPALGAL